MLDLNTKLLIISTKHIQSTIAGNEPITLRFFFSKSQCLNDLSSFIIAKINDNDYLWPWIAIALLKSWFEQLRYRYYPERPFSLLYFLVLVLNYSYYYTRHTIIIHVVLIMKYINKTMLLASYSENMRLLFIEMN